MSGGKWCDKWLNHTRNPDEAARWYRKAACRGNADAQYSLGCMYEKGWKDREPNLEEAEKWYCKAVEKGEGRSALALGDLCWDNQYPDRKEAVMWWYKKAAQCGLPAGTLTRNGIYYQLGVMCEKDCERPPKGQENAKKKKDRENAEKWYCKAEDSAYDRDKLNCLYRLGRLYEAKGDEYEAKGDEESSDTNKAELYEKAKEFVRKGIVRKGEEGSYLRVDPSPHPGVECGLGRMYEKRGRPEAKTGHRKSNSAVLECCGVWRTRGGIRPGRSYGLGCVYERLGCKAARGGDCEGSDSGDSANVCYDKAEGHYRKAAGLPGDDKRRRDADPKRNAAHDKSLASWVDSKVREEDDKRLRDAHDKAMRHSGACTNALGRQEEGRDLWK